jgi:hypothetical protein
LQSATPFASPATVYNYLLINAYLLWWIISLQIATVAEFLKYHDSSYNINVYQLVIYFFPYVARILMIRAAKVTLKHPTPRKEVDMFAIKKMMDAFERLMVAVVFAEANDWKTARTIMSEKRLQRSRITAEKIRQQIASRPVMRI